VAETTAARERVLAARAELEDQLHVLEASGRAAVDIPAKIKRSPAKAAAVAGGLGFLALKGPQRVFSLGRRAVRGKGAPLPKAMLPKEIEKTLRRMGSDGDQVRGTLERDFADYAMQAQKNRSGQRRLLLLAVLQPLLARAARSGADWLFSPEQGGFERRLAELRARVDPNTNQTDAAVDDAVPADPVPPAT
jgi:hypothetical protein